jgi:hypothetical protein
MNLARSLICSRYVSIGPSPMVSTVDLSSLKNSPHESTKVAF